MSSKHNTNYSREEVQDILDTIKSCVKNNMYAVAINPNRKQNKDFAATYNITPPRQKRILMDLVAEDFCYSVNNEHEAFADEILYIFSPQVLLRDVQDVQVVVDVYIKINILENKQRVIVVSFHERNHNIRYLFR